MLPHASLSPEASAHLLRSSQQHAQMSSHHHSAWDFDLGGLSDDSRGDSFAFSEAALLITRQREALSPLVVQKHARIMLAKHDS